MAPVRRHFPPVTSRTRFSPERLLSSQTHVGRIVFQDGAPPSETSNTLEVSRGKDTLLIPNSPDGDTPLIPKPPGEAGRRGTESRNGYNLQKALGWDDALYQEVMVSYSSSDVREAI